MKKLKKALVFLLVMSFLMSALAACGKRGDDKKEHVRDDDHQTYQKGK